MTVPTTTALSYLEEAATVIEAASRRMLQCEQLDWLRLKAQYEEERRLLEIASEMSRYLQIQYRRKSLTPALPPSMWPVLPSTALPSLVPSADTPPQVAAASEGAPQSDELTKNDGLRLACATRSPCLSCVRYTGKRDGDFGSPYYQGKP